MKCLFDSIFTISGFLIYNLYKPEAAYLFVNYMKGCVMSLLKQDKDYTINDIYSLPDGQRGELIDGRLYIMAFPDRRHQRITLELAAIINNYIKGKGGSCEVDIAPFAVFLEADDKNYVEPDISVICSPDKLTDKGCTGRRTGLLRLSLRAAGGWTTILNCSNTALPVSVNTGLWIRKKTESQSTHLNPATPQNILFLKLSKPESMMIWRLISVQ